MAEEEDFRENGLEDNGGDEAEWNGDERVVPLRVRVAEIDGNEGEWEPVSEVAGESEAAQENDDASKN